MMLHGYGKDSFVIVAVTRERQREKDCRDLGDVWKILTYDV